MDSLEILKFYESAGVGEAIGAAPFNFFEYASVGTRPPQAEERKAGAAAGASVADAAKAALDAAALCADIESLDSAVAGFDMCPLRKVATNAVCGTGASSPALMLITEIPSGDEDRSGACGCGEEGAMAAKILAAIGREIGRDAYIAPAVPYRPAGGRAPTDEEAGVMKPFLVRRIAILKPKSMLCMGALPARMLLGLSGPITELRGRVFEYDGMPCACVFSMQFFMANYKTARTAVWEDLQSIRSLAPDCF
ncbi:MAG: uracil-DNA glycosylase [Rickettsiales bacterium]|jgi:DNA polymerase|nr:uracil-DNA glycosylase [Rickettsiales bacterium]